MIYAAAKSLAEFTSDQTIERGYIYPKVSDIRKVSIEVAIKVIQCAFREGLCTQINVPYLDSDELRNHMEKKMYKATYQQIVTTDL